MSRYVFGVDIGGTTVKLGLFNVEGELLEKWEIPTRTQENGSLILPDIARSIEEKISEKQIARQEWEPARPVPSTARAWSIRRSTLAGTFSASGRRLRSL